MLKRFLLLAASVPAVALAQTPPANVTMQNGQPRAVTPTAIVDANGAQLGTPTNPINVTGATSGGGGSTPTGTAGSPNAAVISVQGASGGTPQNVTVTNPTAQGLTDAQLRAAAVPVTVSNPTAQGLTDTQLRASPVSTTVATALPAGANTIGSIANTAFGITGSLPVGTNAIGTVTAVGQVAGGATAAGNPVPMGGVYNTTLPLYTAGQRTDLQSDARGGLRVKPVYSAVPRADGLTYQPSFANTDTGATTFTIPASGLYLWNGTGYDSQRGDANGTYAVTKGSSSIVTGQVSVGTTATLVAAARAGRGRINFKVGAANTCAFGISTVTLTNGYALEPVAGASTSWETNAALYAVCSATTVVSFVETF